MGDGYMKINIYYGGRGLIEDPTLYVLNKLTEVLTEVRANVTRYNLYEQKNGIAMLPNTLKDADAVILAVSVEWFGIGGFMQQFLDACWLYADKSRLKKLYMFPVVISTTTGEREAEYTLIRAWETLGGSASQGICAFASDHVEFESDPSYATLIEKKAEDIYRTVHQKTAVYANSTGAATPLSSGIPSVELTPQESEQLSVYVSDDTFVKKQKQDVEELSRMYKTILDQGKEEGKQEFIREFRQAFTAPEAGFKATYLIQMTDTGRNLVLEIADGKLKPYYGEYQNPDMLTVTTRETVNKIVNGRTTFQGAFMGGQLTNKGDFKLLRNFDSIFRFV